MRCRIAHRYIPGYCCSSFWADIGHIDSTGCLGARKCQGLGSSTLKKVRKVALSPLLLWKWKWE